MIEYNKEIAVFKLDSLIAFLMVSTINGKYDTVYRLVSGFCIVSRAIVSLWPLTRQTRQNTVVLVSV